MTAVSLALVGAVVAIAGVAIAVSVYGVTEQSTPIIVQALVAIGTITTALVAALKASEASTKADGIKHQTNVIERKTSATLETTQLTASKQAALQQALQGQKPHACHDPLCEQNGGHI